MKLLALVPLLAGAAQCQSAPAPKPEVVYVTEWDGVLPGQDVSPPDVLVVIMDMRALSTVHTRCADMGGTFRSPDMCWDVDY